MRYLKSVIFICIVLLSLPVTAEARTVVRSGESVSIQAEQVVEGDLYSAANVVSLSGAITGDALVAAGRAVVSGEVGSDVLVAGGSVLVDATVADDVRVLAGDATLDGQIGGDVAVLAGDVRILSTATIEGDLLVFGGSVEMAGEVSGDVLGTVDVARIDGLVSGNIDITANSLTLGDRAVVIGDVRYVSNEVVTRAPNAVVEGELMRTDGLSEAVSSSSMVRFVLVPLLVLLFAALVWFLLSPRTLLGVVQQVERSSLQAAFIGFGVFLFTPLVAFVLAATVIGSIVGVVLLLAYLLCVLMAFVASGAVLGQWLAIALKFQQVQLVWRLAIGVAVYMLLWLVPFIGAALGLGIFCITLGGLVRGVVAKR